MTYVTDNERSFGLPSADNVTAAEQLQRSYPRVGIQPLPEPYAPGKINGQQVGIQDPMETGDLKFVIIGDSGGIMDASRQRRVVNAMIGYVDKDPDIAFVYHVGDEVYFNGNADQYAPQFYEPYSHVTRPIVGIPGNHDGSVSVDDAGNHTGRAPLDTFMSNFCDAKPNVPMCDPHFEYGRHTQTQPSHDWTLSLHALTIVGLYSNVPSGGHLEDVQVQWLANELKAAPKDVPLMLMLHHPPYSVDAHHGGSKHMGDAIDRAVQVADRIYPTVVVSGHVHDYQRFTRKIDGAGVFGMDQGNLKYVDYLTYLVVGNSGYHNLHRLAKDATLGAPVDHSGAVVFEHGDDRNWGFLVVTVSGTVISGEYVAVSKDGTVTPKFDTFVIGKEA